MWFATGSIYQCGKSDGRLLLSHYHITVCIHANRRNNRDVAATATKQAGPTRTCYQTETCVTAGGSGPTTLSIPTKGTLPLDCPRLNNTTQSIFLGADSWDFKVACGTDYNDVTDIMAIISYSFKDCMQACASFNRNHKADQCTALHWTTDLTNSVPTNYGNCWLKTNTGTQNSNKQNTHAGARLVSSSWG